MTGKNSAPQTNNTGDGNAVGNHNINQTIQADRGSTINNVTQNIYSRSQVEELHDYLARAVAAYETRMYQVVARSAVPLDQPYKFLYAFGVEDTDKFFGRESASEALYQTILQDRLTVLHARSGAGKTSLLNAGLSPRLIREYRLPAYARVHKDPVSTVKQAIISSSFGPWPEPLPRLTLHEFLGIACKHLSRQTQELVIILDQFEEFLIFWSSGSHDQQSFIDTLADCYNDETLPVRFVISIRDDYFGSLATFKCRLANIFYNDVSLESMTREELQEAIVQPVTKLKSPVTYEQTLLDRLLNELLERESQNEPELPHLQIICTRLYDLLAGEKKTITLEFYEKLGGAKGILGNYLQDILKILSGKKETIAREILKTLVSSKATTRSMSYNALAAQIEAEKDELVAVLDSLVTDRLLRRENSRDNIVYELAHEYLIEEINTWLDTSDLDFKQVEELLMREVANWHVHGTLIPIDRLKLLYRYRERFRGWDEETSECILRSALQVDFAVEDWIKLTGDFSEKILFGALEEKNAEVRQKTIKAIEHLDALQTVEPLILCLKDENSSVRLAAVFALLERGENRAVEPLCEALQDEDKMVRVVVAMRLGEFRNPRGVAPLIAALQDEDWTVRRNAIHSLGTIWGLPKYFKSEVEDNNLSLKAAEVLSRIDDPLAAESLIISLQNEESSISDMLNQGLEELNGFDNHQIVKPIIFALQDKDWRVRWEAAKLLVNLDDSRIVEPFITALNNSNSEIRKAIVQILGKTKDHRAVEPLLARLHDENEEVREAAALALGEIGEHAVKPLILTLHNNDKVSQKAALALAKIGEDAVEPLLAVLQNSNNDVARKTAAWILGKIRDSRSVKSLIIALKDQNCNVRRAAAEALGRIKDQHAVDSLITVLQDEKTGIQGAAARALGEIGDYRAIEPLITALNYNNSGARRVAAEALGKIGDYRAVAPLIATLNDKDKAVRQTATEALKKIRTPEALAALKDYNRD